MSEPSYDIYFRGESLEGFETDQVKRNIAQLFKAPPEKVAALFSGKVVALKKGLDKPTAAKFQQALKNAGAKIYIKQAETAAQTAQPQARQATAAVPAAPTPAPSQAAATAQTASLDILPPGSDMLTDDERPHVETIEVDISNIRMANMFDVEEKPETAMPPMPDVSHISVAEAGADMLEGVEHEPPPPAPDVSFISLGDVGEDLIDEHIDIPLPAPDVEHITLAAAGADLETLPKAPPPPAPDTSHIHLDS